MDQTITIKSLIEAGVHLGHKRESWNPKMEPYIFAERKGICVIDPEKTLELLSRACEEAKKIASEGKKILFVGTKRQFADEVKKDAIRCGAFYCVHRWLGGTLTNFSTIRKSVEKMKSLEEQKEKGELNKLTKKERLSIDKELTKMHRGLDGIKDMEEFPGIVYVTDIKKEKLAVHEVVKLGLPIIAIVDTNVDPREITYPIPGNDDSMKSVNLITAAIASSVLEGTEEFNKHKEVESK
ncbi:30S ribosomal protein S2 [candidate division WOR-3 bacterium]|nr:30S ribosomal protein S2 [candidate division WOR-3 bacterium]